MNKDNPSGGQFLEPAFQERVDILFHEIELAVKWDRPSILFAIYRSDEVRDRVNACLRERLTGIDQSSHSIKTDKFDFISEIGSLTDPAKSVLLIDGFHWHCSSDGVHVLSEFNKHREYFIDNNIRAIFWLYEDEVSGFAENATECWILRHRVVDFVDSTPAQEEVKKVPPAPCPETQAPESSEPIGNGTYREIARLAKEKQANGSHVNRLLSTGILCWQKNSIRAALKYLHLASDIAASLDDQPLQAQCQNALALVHAEKGDINEAITAYQKAINLAPESGFLWNNLGQLLTRHERNEDAIQAFKKALVSSPQDFLGWDGIGQTYLKMGLLQNAIASFEKAVELAPKYEYSWAGLGKAWQACGELEKAITALNKAVELNPQYDEAWLALGRCFQEMERGSEALATFQKAVELNPQAGSIWLALGSLYLDMQDQASGISAFQQAASLDPDSLQARIHLARTYQEIGDLESAAAAYEESIPLAAEPLTRSHLMNQLGDVYLHLKFYEKAIAVYEQASRLKPEGEESSPIEEAPAVQETAEVDLSDWEPLNRADEAEDAPLEESPDKVEEISLDEESPGLVEVTENATPGKVEGSIDPVVTTDDASHKFDQRSASEWNDHGVQHLKEGDFNEAIAAFTRAIEMSPNECWPYIQNLAHVHYQKGKMRGRLDPGLMDEADLWEGDDFTTPASLISLESAPTPMRGEVPDENQKEAASEGSYPGEPAPAVDEHPDESGQETTSEESITSDPAPQAEAVIEIKEDEPGSAMGCCVPTEEAEPVVEKTSKPNLIADLPTAQAAAAPVDARTLSALPSLTTPRNSIDWNEAGNKFTRARKYQEAIDAYKQAIELNPAYGQPYNNLGLIYYHLGRFDIAVRLFKKSVETLETRQEIAAAWNKLGDSYRRLGDYSNALAAYQHSSELIPPSNPVMSRARAALLENRISG